MLKFKIGDRVRFIADDSPFCIGEKGTIIDVGPERVAYPYTVRAGGRIGLVKQESLELIEGAPAGMPYKEGDRVRIVSNAPYPDAPHWSPRMDSTLGKIGLVKNVYDSGRLQVSFDDGNDWYYHLSWVEPAESVKKQDSILAQRVRDLMSSAHSPSTTDMPLIQSTTLLTTIKLD